MNENELNDYIDQLESSGYKQVMINSIRNDKRRPGTNRVIFRRNGEEYKEKFNFVNVCAGAHSGLVDITNTMVVTPYETPQAAAA